MAPRWVSEQQVQALAGIFYEREVEAHGADPGDAGGWEAEPDRLKDLAEPEPDKPQHLHLTKHEIEPARELLGEHGPP